MMFPLTGKEECLGERELGVSTRGKKIEGKFIFGMRLWKVPEGLGQLRCENDLVKKGVIQLRFTDMKGKIKR